MEKVAEKKQTVQKFSKEQYIQWYESMLLMRRFEERAQQAMISSRRYVVFATYILARRQLRPVRLARCARMTI